MANRLEEGYSKADSGNLPQVTTFMVYEFITTDERFIDPEVTGAKTENSARECYGENAIGYVCLSRDGDLCTVKAKMCPEHKNRDKSYTVSIIINEVTQTVDDMGCVGCPAGEGGCKHAFAFLMWLNRRYEEPACTEVECYWKKSVSSGIGTKLRFIAVSEIIKKKSTPKRKHSVDRSAFLDDVICQLDKYQVDTQLSRYKVQLISRKVYTLSLYQLLLAHFSQAKQTSANDFVEYSKGQMNQILCFELEEQTREQSESLLWHEARFGRITASKLYSVAQCKTEEGSLVKLIVDASKVYDNKYMKRGRLLEHQVYDELCRLGHKLSKSGFSLLRSCPIFGGSPDAISSDFIVEIKCPISEDTSKTYVLNGKIADRYKAQMMLQMLITNKKKGLFVVADWDFENNKKLHTYWLHYDEGYLSDLMDRAIVFWKKYIYPVLTKHLHIQN